MSIWPKYPDYPKISDDMPLDEYEFRQYIGEWILSYICLNKKYSFIPIKSDWHFLIGLDIYFGDSFLDMHVKLLPTDH